MADGQTDLRGQNATSPTIRSIRHCEQTFKVSPISNEDLNMGGLPQQKVGISTEVVITAC